jgi:U2-associated protein SR140
LIILITFLVDENIDGIPLDTSGNADEPSSSGFVKSKWEELDPEQVAHQAITTSKWEFEPPPPEAPKISSICNYDESESSESDSEDKRKRLREIEIKIVEYQDELESGKIQQKSGFSVSEQVEHYRRKLLRKAEKHDSDSHSDRYISSSSSKRERCRRSSSSGEKRMKRHRRSPSNDKYHRTKRSRSRSYSPIVVSKSRYSSIKN